MNRHQRRALSKKMGGQLQPIAEAATKLEQALGAVKQFDNAGDVERLVHEAHTTVMALVDDVQKMADEQEVLRNLLFDRDPALKLAYERALAPSVSMGTMVPSKPPCPECVKNGPCPHL